jgi:hypothetical protein
VWLAAASWPAGAAAQGAPKHGTVDRTVVRVTEIAHDGTWPLTPDARSTVDHDARLVVSFEVPASDTAPPSPAWDRSSGSPPPPA